MIVIKGVDVVVRQANPFDMQHLFSLTTELLMFNIDNISESTMLL